MVGVCVFKVVVMSCHQLGHNLHFSYLQKGSHFEAPFFYDSPKTTWGGGENMKGTKAIS